MTQPTDEWVRYIKRQLDNRERSVVGAVADMIAPIKRNRRAALDVLCAEARAVS